MEGPAEAVPKEVDPKDGCAGAEVVPPNVTLLLAVLPKFPNKFVVVVCC